MHYNFGLKAAGAAVSDSALASPQGLPSPDYDQPRLPPRRKTASADKRALSLSAVGAPWLFSLGQGLSVVLASLVAGIGYHELASGVPGPIGAFLAVGLLIGVLFAGAMHIVDGARPLRKLNGRQALRDTSIVWVCALLLVTFLAFALKAGEELSRGAVLGFVCAGYMALLLTRSSMPQLMAVSSRLANGAGRHVLVIGARGHSAAGVLVAELAASGHHSPTRIEIDAGCDDINWHTELPVSLGKIFSSSHNNGPGDIFVAAEGFSAVRLHDITDSIRVIPRAVRVIPDASTEALLRLPVQNIGRFSSLELQKPPMNALQRAGKRGLDLAISVPLLVFIAPLLAAIAIAVKLDSRGPTIFSQNRLGCRGRSFMIFKFRTMNVLENGEVVTQASRNDMRVTRIGRLLRRSSLDELPQLLNVIRGEMSLVGPRPHAMAHDAYYAKRVMHYEIRQHVKPGITGWAQVNGLRGETASADLMSKRVEFDIWYAKNASLWLDIKILFLTAVEIFRQRNAY